MGESRLTKAELDEIHRQQKRVERKHSGKRPVIAKIESREYGEYVGWVLFRLNVEANMNDSDYWIQVEASLSLSKIVALAKKRKYVFDFQTKRALEGRWKAYWSEESTS